LGAFTDWSNYCNLPQLSLAEMDCGAVRTVLITIGHLSTEKINFWWNLRITSCWWLGTSEKVGGFHGLVKLLQSPATLLSGNGLRSRWNSSNHNWPFVHRENQFLVESSDHKLHAQKYSLKPNRNRQFLAKESTKLVFPVAASSAGII
jgi:hypothetical protein